MAMSLTLDGIPQPKAQGPAIHTKTDMTDAEALAFVDKHYNEKMRDLPKYLFERQWFLNYLYMIGLQSIPKSGPLSRLEQNPLPTWKRRYIENRILPMYMRRVSQLNSAMIPWDMIPKSPDYQDLQACAVAKSALFAKQDPIGIDASRWEVSAWQVLNGPGFFKVEWDEWADGSTRIYIDPLSQTPIPTEKITPEIKSLLDRQKFYVEKPSGDIRVRPCSPFEIFVPVLATGTDIDSAPWLMHVRQYTMDELYNRYDPAKVKEVTPDRDLGLHTYMTRRLKTIVSSYGYFSAVEDRMDDEMATIRECWIPPSRRSPEGRLIVCSRNKVLLNIPHPLKDLRIRYPFAKADYAPTPSRFYGKGMVEDMILPQSELNRTGTIVHQIRDTMGQPKWWYEKGSGIGPITSEPGQLLMGKMGSKPPVPLVAQVDHQLHELIRQHLLDGMNTIAAQSDVTQAKIPPSVRSGAAIQMLQEKDDNVIGPATRSMEKALARVGQMTLRFMSKYYKDYRLIELHGSSRAMDVMYFRGDDLRNNDRVFVKPGSLQPKSSAAETSKALELVQTGVLNPQMDRDHMRMVVKAMEFNYAEPMFVELEADERRAQQENSLFFSTDLAQPLPEVKPFDDHQAHLRIHNTARKGDQYEMMPPALQEAMDAHCAVHEQFLQAAMMQQMAMTQSQKGAPGDKGKASQPSDSGDSEAA